MELPISAHSHQRSCKHGKYHNMSFRYLFCSFMAIVTMANCHGKSRNCSWIQCHYKSSHIFLTKHWNLMTDFVIDRTPFLCISITMFYFNIEKRLQKIANIVHTEVHILSWCLVLKGIIWDRRWSTPSIRISSHTCWFFYGNAFLLIKLSKLPRVRAIRALIASQSTFEI